MTEFRTLRLTDPKKTFRVMTLLWGAMAFSLLVYLVVVYRLSFTPLLQEASGWTVALALFLLAGAVGVQALIHALMLADGRVFPRMAGLAGGTLGVRPEQAEELRRIPLEDRAPILLLQVRLVTGVLMWAQADAMGILGAALAFLTGDRAWAVVFTVLALLNLLVLFPRRSVYEEQLSRWRIFLLKAGAG